MKYCADRQCPDRIWTADDDNYCGRCGGALTPCILCLCGKEEYNPKWPDKACQGCGTRWTDAHLAACMSAQLKGLVQEIAEKQAGMK